MDQAELLQLVEKKDISAFESRCIELLSGGNLRLADLHLPLRKLQQTGESQRVVTVAQMALDAAGEGAEPHAALRVARVALEADGRNNDLRQRVCVFYQQAYGAQEGFEAAMEAAGLRSGRPVRNALRILDLCLNTGPADTLMSRTDSHIVEVTEVDRTNGLFTIRKGGRLSTLPLSELAREYEPIAKDDFRVVRELWPDKLAELIANDPVRLVAGILHAHADHMDVDELRNELVPRYLPAADWTKWWNGAKALLKKAPNVVMEGRSPVVLRYSARGQSFEDECWSQFSAMKDAVKQLDVVESYLREKARWKEAPDAALLERFVRTTVSQLESAREKRPHDALAAGLTLRRMAELGLPVADAHGDVALTILKETPDPVRVFQELESDALWSRALELLPQAVPDYADTVVALFSTASSSLLDQLVGMAASAGALDRVSAVIQSAVAEPVRFPDVIYWLWKRPAKGSPIEPPPERELFLAILDALSSLGRSTQHAADAVKNFRNRMKAALALRDYAQARRAVEQLSAGQALTLKTQVSRLDVGDNTTSALNDMLRKHHPQLWHKPKVVIAVWEDENVIWTSDTGMRRKNEERDILVNVTMRDNARRIGEAAALGDLSENSEYKFALEERDLLRARLAQMNREMEIARIIDPRTVPTDHVSVGSTVTLRRTDSGATQRVTFLGPFDTRIEEDVYNYRAPLSQKVMGRAVGDRVVLTLSDVESEFEIAAIEVASQLG